VYTTSTRALPLISKALVINQYVYTTSTRALPLISKALVINQYVYTTSTRALPTTALNPLLALVTHASHGTSPNPLSIPQAIEIRRQEHSKLRTLLVDKMVLLSAECTGDIPRTTSSPFSANSTSPPHRNTPATLPTLATNSKASVVARDALAALQASSSSSGGGIGGRKGGGGGGKPDKVDKVSVPIALMAMSDVELLPRVLLGFDVVVSCAPPLPSSSSSSSSSGAATATRPSNRDMPRHTSGTVAGVLDALVAALRVTMRSEDATDPSDSSEAESRYERTGYGGGGSEVRPPFVYDRLVFSHSRFRASCDTARDESEVQKMEHEPSKVQTVEHEANAIAYSALMTRALDVLWRTLVLQRRSVLLVCHDACVESCFVALCALCQCYTFGADASIPASPARSRAAEGGVHEGLGAARGDEGRGAARGDDGGVLPGVGAGVWGAEGGECGGEYRAVRRARPAGRGGLRESEVEAAIAYLWRLHPRAVVTPVMRRALYKTFVGR
jgi:hypothetical protein